MARVGLLVTSLVAGCRPRASLSGASWVLRSVVVAGAVCCGGGSRWEEGCLCPDLVGCLIHLGLDVLWLSYWVSQLDDQIVIQVILVR